MSSAHGAPPDEASVLARASGLLAEGNLAGAGDLLHEAAADALAFDDAAGAIRLLQLSAATARSAGAPEMARARAEHAASLARELHSPDPSLTVLALAESAECALTLGSPLTAAEEFGEAAAVASIPDVVRTALCRRRASALADAGEAVAAVAVLQDLVDGGTPAGEELAHIRLEMAGVAQRGLLPDRGRYLRDAVEALAEVAHPELHADLELMQAAAAVEEGRTDLALVHARRARDHAGHAEAPVAYIGASMSIVQFLEESPSSESVRNAVYAVLTDSWRRLERFAGEDIARTAFQPALEQRRRLWGSEAFAAAETAVARRAEAR